jgi:hypothetical protein
MAAVRERICTCGSGLPFVRCHGNPFNYFAREQALAEAEMVAMLFPTVRVRGEHIEEYARRMAAMLPGEDDIPEPLIEEGLDLVGRAERRRVVESWSHPYADRWASITYTAGRRGAAETALVAGALRAAIAEVQPTPRGRVEPFEDESLRRSPLAAVALVVPPMFVWSRDEAEAATAAAAGRRKLRDRLRTIEHVGFALITHGHVRRLRRLAAFVAAELPFAGLPAASESLAGACRAVAADDEDARAATVASLLAYVEEIDLARA